MTLVPLSLLVWLSSPHYWLFGQQQSQALLMALPQHWACPQHVSISFIPLPNCKAWSQKAPLPWQEFRRVFIKLVLLSRWLPPRNQYPPTLTCAELTAVLKQHLRHKRSLTNASCESRAALGDKDARQHLPARHSSSFSRGAHATASQILGTEILGTRCLSELRQTAEDEGRGQQRASLMPGSTIAHRDTVLLPKNGSSCLNQGWRHTSVHPEMVGKAP